jgi:hypothetical protein
MVRSQGTVSNFDFGQLVAPTLAALANDPDVLASFIAQEYGAIDTGYEIIRILEQVSGVSSVRGGGHHNRLPIDQSSHGFNGNQQRG